MNSKLPRLTGTWSDTASMGFKLQSQIHLVIIVLLVFERYLNCFPLVSIFRWVLFTSGWVFCWCLETVSVFFMEYLLWKHQVWFCLTFFCIIFLFAYLYFKIHLYFSLFLSIWCENFTFLFHTSDLCESGTAHAWWRLHQSFHPCYAGGTFWPPPFPRSS